MERGFGRSLIPFQLPLAPMRLFAIGERSTPWCRALSMNISANTSQAGEPAEARIKCSTVSCQWGRSCWALGSF